MYTKRPVLLVHLTKTKRRELKILFRNCDQTHLRYKVRGSSQLLITEIIRCGKPLDILLNFTALRGLSVSHMLALAGLHLRLLVILMRCWM